MRIYIPTRGRADKQITLKNLPSELLKNAALVVDNDELVQHQKYADQIELIALPSGYPSGIGPKRRFIVDQHDVAKYGPKLVMVDDDLSFAKRRKDNPDKFDSATSHDVVVIFQKLEKLLDQYAHVSLRSRQGANQEHRPLVEITRAMTVLGFDVNVLRKHGIKFDRLRVMEDFDVVLQLLRLGYKNAVIGDYIFSGSPSNSSGGCSIERTMKVQQEAAHKLAELHAPFVRTVIKKTKSAWNGAERSDVIVQWKRAYDSSEVASDPSAKPETLTEQQLKTRLRSANRKYEASAKQEMAPLLYWLRERLRAQGSRNDIHDKDRGFGAWVEDNLEISRRTADRWCEWYAEQAGLKETVPTFGQMSKGDEAFYQRIVNEHRSLVPVKYLHYFVKPRLLEQYSRAVESLRAYFKAENDKEAIFKGVFYAAKIIATTSATRSGRKRIPAGRTGRLDSSRNGRGASVGASAIASRKNGKRTLDRFSGVPNLSGPNGHWRKRGPRSEKAVAGGERLHPTAG